jgi:hypothetical protein
MASSAMATRQGQSYVLVKVFFPETLMLFPILLGVSLEKEGADIFLLLL